MMTAMTIETIKAEIKRISKRWNEADEAGDEAVKSELNAEYDALVEELEDATAEAESDHLLGEHGPGAELDGCPSCDAASRREAEMVAAIARLNEAVTEEWCSLCRRATDHRGEHTIEELDDESATVTDATSNEPWSGGFAANH